MGDVVEIRDYQSRAAIERAHKALEEHLNQQAIQIANEAFPSASGFSETSMGIHPLRPYDPKTHWPSDYRDKDPA